MKFNAFLITCFLFISSQCPAVEKTVIRIGVQAYGTVEWELSALQDEAQASQAGFKIETRPVANSEAGRIALQAGAVDMIVSDWLWVSRLRAAGADFTFYPYSGTSGALIVPDQSPIRSVKDIKGKRLGIAGGELDKNWLLLQALAQREQFDLNDVVEKVFAAPPLLDEQLRQNRIDAALTYWHFAAKLEASGFRQIIDGRGILKGLGINENIPNLGYVFRQSWADSHKQPVNEFLKAARQAKATLCKSDSGWRKILPLTQSDDASIQNKLRQRYCEGSVEQWGAPEQQAAGRLYKLLGQLSNKQLTGPAESVPAGTFWQAE